MIVELDFDKTYPYATECLDDGKSLSKWISENIDLKTGRFFTFICDSTDRESLYEFTHAVIFPYASPQPVLIHNQMMMGTPVESWRPSVIDFLIEWLVNNKLSFCVLEEVLKSLESPGVKQLQSFNCVRFLSEDILYFFDKKNHPKNLFEKALRFADAVWHCIGFAGKWKQESELNDTNFPIENVDKNGPLVVIIGAYDSESYILWVKDAEIENQLTQLIGRPDEIINEEE